MEGNQTSISRIHDFLLIQKVVQNVKGTKRAYDINKTKCFDEVKYVVLIEFFPLSIAWHENRIDVNRSKKDQEK